MADVREVVLLDHMDTSRFRVQAAGRLRSRIKLAIRWLVVATSSVPLLRHLYVAIYRMHVRYALHVLRKFSGIQSIYATGSVATENIRPGISDIDLTINGEFSDEEQMKLVNALRGLSRLSPLYDTLLGQCVQTIPALRSLYETDYFFQYRFDQGRDRWKLLHGDDVFALLPPVPAERLAGGFYTEARTWWCYFVKSAFGDGPMADDAIFRRTIAYKSHAGILNVASALHTNIANDSREDLLANALATATGAEKAFLERLVSTVQKPHRAYAGDIQQDTFSANLRVLEQVHADLPITASFRPVTSFMHVDASRAEMLFAPETENHVRNLVERVQKEWTGFQSAFLVPSLSFFNPDDLVLLLEVAPDSLPAISQIRELCAWNKRSTRGFKQRIALFLLLPNGAYQLEIVSTIELWHHLLCPAANPEVFALLHNPEFVIAGKPRAGARQPQWTRFANDLVSEELMIRRSAMAKMNSIGDMNSLETLRNLWRHLQLEIIEQSVSFGHAFAPLTLPAMQRAVQLWGLPDASLFDQLREAYIAELNGHPTDIRPLIEHAMNLFANLQPQAHR